MGTPSDARRRPACPRHQLAYEGLALWLMPASGAAMDLSYDEPLALVAGIVLALQCLIFLRNFRPGWRALMTPAGEWWDGRGREIIVSDRDHGELPAAACWVFVVVQLFLGALLILVSWKEGKCWLGLVGAATILAAAFGAWCRFKAKAEAELFRAMDALAEASEWASGPK